jgi:hypothetical protein
MIWKTNPESGRAALGFTEVVLATFDFLIKEYGFHCVTTELTFVRYESQFVFVNIYHGRASYVLGFEVGQLVEPGTAEQKFTIGEIIDLMSAQKETGFTFLQASTRDRVQMLVPRLAELARKYAGDALRGDPLAFERLQDLQSRRSKEYLKEMELHRIRQKADDAWRKKDYTTVVELYKSIDKDLTHLETKKLQYSEKQLSR